MALRTLVRIVIFGAYCGPLQEKVIKALLGFFLNSLRYWPLDLFEFSFVDLTLSLDFQIVGKVLFFLKSTFLSEVQFNSS